VWSYRFEKILEVQKKYFLYFFCAIFAGITYGIGYFILIPFFGEEKQLNRKDSDLGRKFLSILRKAVEPLLEHKTAEVNAPSASGSEWERFHDPEHAITCWNDQQTQWWYFSGNLVSGDGRRFGYELVFFRRKTLFDFLGFLPGRWFKRNLFVAHFALSQMGTEASRKRFHYWHRGGFFSNTHVFASSDSFHVEVGGWSAYQDSAGDIHLNAQFMWDSIRLKLHPKKDLVYHSQDGYSRRDTDPQVASYHCSYTRLETSGEIMCNGEVLGVEGSSWMDHEKMLAGRDRLSLGWDWYSIQFDHGEELMLYLFHNPDGSVDRQFSYGTFVNSKGKSVHLAPTDIELEVLGTWTSPTSGGTYPSQITLGIHSLQLKLDVNVPIPHCELNCVSTTFVAYWEGPIQVSGLQKGNSITGRGYLELCGYDRRSSSKLVHFMFTPEPHSLKNHATPL